VTLIKPGATVMQSYSKCCC